MYLTLEAGPGSGKSTTLLEAFKFLHSRNYNGFIPTGEQVNICHFIATAFPKPPLPTQTVFLAFNTDIKDYIVTKLPKEVKAYTFNGMGQSIVFRRHGHQALDRYRGEKLLAHNHLLISILP
jgi:hypothetical protein